MRPCVLRPLKSHLFNGPQVPFLEVVWCWKPCCANFDTLFNILLGFWLNWYLVHIIFTMLPRTFFFLRKIFEFQIFCFGIRLWKTCFDLDKIWDCLTLLVYVMQLLPSIFLTLSFHPSWYIKRSKSLIISYKSWIFQ